MIGYPRRLSSWASPEFGSIVFRSIGLVNDYDSAAKTSVSLPQAWESLRSPHLGGTDRLKDLPINGGPQWPIGQMLQWSGHKRATGGQR